MIPNRLINTGSRAFCQSVRNGFVSGSGIGSGKSLKFACAAPLSAAGIACVPPLTRSISSHRRPTPVEPSPLSPRAQSKARQLSYASRLSSPAPSTPALAQHTEYEPSATGLQQWAKWLPKVKRSQVKKVLLVGSGGLSIGQAGEFDYSGSQAIKALRESGIETILINPNIATIQTSHHLASQIYFLPISPEYVAYVLEKERPDGVLLTFGGQSALNVGVKLDEMGVFERLGVEVLGSQVDVLRMCEDRDLFVQALDQINIPVAKSEAVSSVNAALKAAEDIGYPVIVRAAYALGGLGSGFAENEEELRDLSARSLSLSPQILVEKSLKGWKESEYEVLRDQEDNAIICCNMENFDPLGIHTGDSIVVAPSQTLSDDNYHMLRTAALKVIRHLGIVGECNIQYALSPDSREYRVIEVNPRLSRSSALASKATGYPLAYTAAKLALGHTLPELPNAVTKTTTACFEPSLDYIVTKIPKWDLSKFQHVNREIGSSMKSVGEVMAIGRTFEESLQKAIRQIAPNYDGFAPYIEPVDLDHALAVPTDTRLFAIAYAMLVKGYDVERLHDLTKIDRWFLHKLQNIVDIHHTLKDLGEISAVDKETVLLAKQRGFSDRQIAQLTNSTEDVVRKHRKSLGVTPFVKRIDTVAAEYPAHTNYLYTTYNATTHDVEFDDNGTMVLGSGVYRIGSSVEFDWCAVTCARRVRSMNHKTIMINYNPETVSTDFDEADRLYFEELGFERVMDIYELEGASGVVVSVGGQLPQNIALRLKNNEVNVLGTDPVMIDSAEDRHKFSSILDQIGVDQPEWVEVTTVEKAKEFASKVGYPVLVRPSYVLSGAAMNVIWDESTLQQHLTGAAEVNTDYPVVLSKFIDNAQEIDVDAVAYKGELLVHAVSEHVENAGVHSGDATLVLPPFSLDPNDLQRLKAIAQKVAKAFQISGPFNMQVIRKPAEEGETEAALKVIECNLRASRSFPFVSKVLGVNFIDIATCAIVGQDVPKPVDLMNEKRDYVAIKVPVFSWTRLAGADPFLGVEMASTGEVASFGKDLAEAYWASIASTTGFRVPEPNKGVLIGGDISKPQMASVARRLYDLGFKLYCSNAEVESFLNSIPHVSAKRIWFPLKDKRKLREVFDEYEIQFVVNLAKSRGRDTMDEDYVARRNAVDFGVPLINEARCAELFVEALERKIPQGGLLGYQEGKIPPEVKSWREFVPDNTA
ncbi:putative arginine-specific carbamoyl-phosphate synthetase, ammonia chain [Tilletiaria anomala UBC 951]|uniref:Ammonium-dependent carbamoyl phosphate synthetase n=1 Tax=Tilletiaria anomala (strain ATCC 24038 / CBS 436.72 / UBC 951) TaxID=1037660 RepID=A0A066WNP3_TILAU|nr:putative arginine-specific carbamoyl-phosphate synthetase, ammonia chain [Tilletiaria anomala UBC 951]KDN52624.1 putative arginine-specific carbamoyl-phosphate synthetase, ammonia chain [Tilletiaria anomala UBC 951]